MRRIGVLSALVLISLPLAAAAARVRIVSSTTDLASIAAFVGGDRVEVDHIASGRANPHFVEVLPSYMVKVARAKIYLKVGMGLDLWADYIIDGSRNGNLIVIDCSRLISPLEKPNVKVDASMGDVHPQGNPHYWLDPDNGVLIAREVEEKLEMVDPEGTEKYRQNLTCFSELIEKKKREWLAKASPLRGARIVTYHNSWPYFCRFLGIEVVGFVEPKPGIEPTPSHTARLVDMIRGEGIRVIGKEPYYSARTPDQIARLTGAKVVELPPSVGGAAGIDDYFALFDFLIDRLLKTLEE